MHISSWPFVSTSADEEQAAALQNFTIPHILGLDQDADGGNKGTARIR
jgi:hypothetical protein